MVIFDAAYMFLYRDASVAPLLDMRRRFKAVMDVLGAMIRSGISLSRQLNLLLSGTGFLLLGLCILLHLMISLWIGVWTLVLFYHAASDVHRRLSDFIHVVVVVCRRDEAIRGRRNWIREDSMVHPYRWLRPDLFPPAPFLQCEPHFTLGGSGVLADPARIDEEFRKAWLPCFCRSGQGIPASRNSIMRLRGGYLCCLRFHCLG